MTMYKPNLRIDRLIVYSRGKSVYDERFHAGLNIIRGENSSGKSTIIDFLFYGLGGDLFDWREIALNCDVIYLQVQVNGIVLTLSREIINQSSRPMRMYLGSLDDALLSASEGWELYSYSRSSKESFSQVLFRFLGLPEVQLGESQTKITMNQILRLMYADQISPIDKVFRFQQFDDAITRQTVGDLLCGAFSDAFYRAQIRTAQASNELREVQLRIKSIIATYASDRTPLTREWLNAEISRSEKELGDKNLKIEELEEQIFHAQFDDRLTLNDQNETYIKIVEFQTKIAEVGELITRKSFEYADSSQFWAGR